MLDSLEKRELELKQIIHDKEIALQIAPDGLLQVCHSHNKTHYYHVCDEKRVYIKEKEKALVKALCQKDYDQKILKSAQQELRCIEKFKRDYPKQVLEDIYDHTNQYRKPFVQPVQLPDDEYVRAWEQTEYVKKEGFDNVPELYTHKNERVRSKSEVLIANALERYGIPYRYEAPLQLHGMGTIHPDFTVLNVRTRKELYWEHLGMMDDSGYQEKAFLRIVNYEKNNIFPGDRLIWTYETRRYPLHVKMIDKVIQTYLM